jgi:hypothetical protein
LPYIAYRGPPTDSTDVGGRDLSCHGCATTAEFTVQADDDTTHKPRYPNTNGELVSWPIPLINENAECPQCRQRLFHPWKVTTVIPDPVQVNTVTRGIEGPLPLHL